MKVTDPDVRILAGLSTALQIEYEASDSAWSGSPFEWIRERPSRQVGMIGERLVAGWLAARGFNVTRAPDSDADRLVEGRRVEVKLSTLWASGHYKFQQLRDQDYEMAICLGLSPFTAHCWVIPKADIIKLWRVQHVIRSQHGGAAGNDTAWIDVQGDSPATWIQKYGGTLSDAVKVLSLQTGFSPKPIREDEVPYEVSAKPLSR